MSAHAVPSAALQAITFALGDTRYGITIDSVLEILTLPAITPMPDLPAFIEGIINLRGNIIPVIDLRKRLNLPPHTPTPATRIIVVEFAAAEGSDDWLEVGLIVDAVRQVTTFAPGTLQPPPALVGGLRRDYLQAIADDGSGLVVLLDIAKILSAAEQAVLSAAEFTAAGGA